MRFHMTKNASGAVFFILIHLKVQLNIANGENAMENRTAIGRV